VNILVTSLPVVYINVLMAWALWFPIAAGQLSMAVPSFSAIGAYSTSLFTIHVANNLALSLLLAGSLGCLFGVPVGLMCARFNEFGLAVATLGIVEIQVIVIQNASWLGGALGLSSPTSSITWLAFGATIVVLAFSVAVFRGRQGRSLDLLAHSEELTAALGVSPLLLKLYVMMVSGLVGGIAGALYARYVGYLDPSQFDSDLIVQLLAFVVVGGTASYWGPVLGAVSLTLGLQYLSVADSLRYILFGIILIVVIVFRRDGLIFRSSRRRARRLEGLLDPQLARLRHSRAD
jgi:branched-chain amino acid transport system permease protein